MKILIADDERLVRYSLISILKKLDIPDLEVVEAVNGKELIEKVKSFHPDGAFVDIRMPGISGLDALEKLKSEHPGLYGRITWFILTGFADFEFARKAITVDVENYLLKPVAAKEVRYSVETIERNIKKITAESRIRREAALIRMFNQKTEDHDPYDFSEFLFHRGTLLMGDRFLSLSENMERNRILTTGSYELRGQGIEYTAAFVKDERSLCFIESTSGRELLGNDLVNYLKEKSEKGGWTPATLVRTGVYSDIRKVAAEAEKIISSAGKRHFFGREGNIRLLEFETLHRLQDSGIGEFAEDLFYACYTADSGLMDRAVRRKPEITVDDRTAEILIENLGVLFNITDNVSSVDKLIEDTVKKYRYSDGGKDLSPVVLRTLDIIEKRYSEPIGISEVSDLLSVSPNYLSSLFKKEMNISFTSYLTLKRLEISRRLLLEDGMTVKKTAALVGYLSEKHFSKVFKRYYSVSPSVFKAGNIQKV